MSKTLQAENLVFDRGDSTFDAETFARTLRPYWSDLVRVNRTNYLFVAAVEGQKPVVTGYATEVTINATINSRALECERLGGKWAVYRLP